MEQIQWLEKSWRLSDLRPYERNPRQISESQYKKLKTSIQEDGYHTRIKATHDGRVIGGHQRLKAMRELGYEEIIILVPSRPLSDAEFQRIMVRDNVNNGSWDFDMLSTDFDLEELREMGVDEVMNIAPFDEEDKSHAPGVTQVKCPSCDCIFPVKGNKADVGSA